MKSIQKGRKRPSGGFRLESAGESKAHCGQEALLHRGVDRAQHPIQLTRVNAVVRELTGQEDRILLTDAERDPEQRPVTAQQLREARLTVLLGGTA